MLDKICNRIQLQVKYGTLRAASGGGGRPTKLVMQISVVQPLLQQHCLGINPIHDHWLHS
jgi:hypothetical protein